MDRAAIGGDAGDAGGGYGEPYPPPPLIDRPAAKSAMNRLHLPTEGGPPDSGSRGVYTQNEILRAGHGFFGNVSSGLASAIEWAFQKGGRPNGYILGQDAGGAIVAGLRYGEGKLHTKDAGDHKVFWQGPSVGYDFGGEGSKVMVLVYNLRDPSDIYTRFGGVAGCGLRRRRRWRTIPKGRRRHAGTDPRRCWAAARCKCRIFEVHAKSDLEPVLSRRHSRRSVLGNRARHASLSRAMPVRVARAYRPRSDRGTFEPGSSRLITVYAAMHVILGFLIAAFLLLLLLPAYRRRIERFAIESLKRTLPLTEAEINAGKDRIRAAFAIDVHKLEMKLEDATLAAARQSIEINRRDAKIHDLEQADRSASN